MKKVRNKIFLPGKKEARNGRSPLWILLLCTCCLMSAVAAKAQSLRLEFKDAGLLEVLESIRRQSGYTFVYNIDDIREAPGISVNIEDNDIKRVMDRCLANTGLVCLLHDNTIVIKKGNPLPVNFKVKGRITDEKGVPLPRASVVIKGTSYGVATDTDGRFSIDLPKGNEILVISFIGMEKKEIRVNGRHDITVRLKEEDQSLSEVVCTGYQNIRKERNTGSIEMIEAKDLVGRPFVSVDQLLIGKLSGVSSFMGSGQAGGNASINIRGVNTLSGSSQPLWIVDGLPMQGETPDIKGGGTMLEANILTNGIGNIAPSDIRSITVLKDAAAAAIYGARAANGVIVITTKRGVEGDLYCNYTGNIEMGNAPHPDLGFMNTHEKIRYERELWEDWNSENYNRRNQGLVGQILSDVKSGAIGMAEGEKRISELEKYDTDWFKEIYRNSFSHTHNLSLTGGNRKMSYYSSINYANNQGILKNDVYENLNVNLRGTYKPSARFDLTFSLSNTSRKKKYHNSIVDPFRYALYANPYESPYDLEGNLRYDRSYLDVEYKKGEETFKFDKFNILNELDNTGHTSRYNSTSLSLEMNWYILKNLKYTGRAVKTITNKNDRSSAAPGTYTSFVHNWYSRMINRDVTEEENNGFLNRSSAETRQYSVNNSLDFNIETADHFFNAYIGQEISAIKTEDFYTMMPEYSPDMEIGGYPNIKDVIADKIDLKSLGDIGFLEQRYASFFANASYGYRDCYIISLNGRMDGADIIGSDNRFTPLWSVSGRWNLHKNRFFKKNRILNEFSLKAEYGYTGNINRKIYPFTTMKISDTKRYKGVLIASETTYPNPVIKWENKHEKSAGFEASLLDYRINLTFSYYHNKVKDVLSYKRLPGSTGIKGYFVNSSNLLNKGFEVSMNATPVKTDNLMVGLDFNIACNKNRVSNSYYSSVDQITMDLVKKEQPIVDGYSTGAVFGVMDKGVDPESGERMVEGIIAQNLGLTGKPTNTTEYRNQIVERDLLQDHDKVIYLGQTTPKFYGGFGFFVRYRNFDLNTVFNFEGGHIISKFNERLSSPHGSKPLKFSKTNVKADRLNRWRQYGDISNYEKYDLYAYKANTIPMDSDYEKGDYLKCRNISLTYRFASRLLDSLPVRIKRASISFQADNLFTLTHYSGIDPELRKDFGYPLSRNYRFSLQIGF